MIKEALNANCGIEFLPEALRHQGISNLDPEYTTELSESLRSHLPTNNLQGERCGPQGQSAIERDLDILTNHGHYNSDPKIMADIWTIADVQASIFDQLEHSPWWWIAECLPLLAIYQREDSSWVERKQY